jgi:MFS transporter, AAHS family, 4-hydroxybenzoate transporter
MNLSLQEIKVQTNERPMRPLQVLMIILCFVLNFCDGIDVVAVSFSSSEIIKEFLLSKTEMGYVFSSALAGMTIGCFFIAPYADRYGRRNVLLLSLFLISISMLSVAVCKSYAVLLLLRFITGLGIGSILPTMAATASEFSNNKYRDFNVALVQAGWPVGAIIISFVAANMIPSLGWRFIFLIAGIISSVLFLIVYFFVTDTIDYLLIQQPSNALSRTNQLLEKLRLPALTTLPDKPTLKSKQSARDLFGQDYRIATIKSWLAVFFGFITLYTLMSWVPTIAREMGMSASMAIYAGTALNAGAAIGSASNGALGSKYGLVNTISLFMVTGFSIMLLYANFNWSIIMLFILIFLIGLFVQGGFNGLFPALTRIYPASIRATGTGYAFGIGRLGAILGPALYGILADLGLSTTTLFSLFAIPLLTSGIIVYGIRSPGLLVTQKKSLERK